MTWKNNTYNVEPLYVIKPKITSPHNEHIERDKNTATCLKCHTNWKTQSLAVEKCPFCGHNEVIVSQGEF